MSFYFLAAILLVSALLVVTLRNIFHCALFLIIALLATAGFYFYLGAPFVGVMQLLIYVGAIMVLIIFAIMLTARISDRLKKVSTGLAAPALIASLALFYFLLTELRRTPLPGRVSAPLDALNGLGLALMTTYVLPFELISLILLAALVAAIVLARKD